MKIKRIAHIGIAVNNVDQARAVFNGMLDLPFIGEEMVGELKIGFINVGQTNLEFVQSTTPEGTIAQHIAKRGEGIQHVAFEVEDIDSALAELKAKGVRLIDEQARPGAHGARIAFIHPKMTHGVLTELCEYTEKH